MIEISSEKKKRISGKTIAIAIFLTIITTVVAGGAYLISIFNKYEKVEIDKEAIGVVEVTNC